MRCPACDNPVRDNVKECPACGENLVGKRIGGKIKKVIPYHNIYSLLGYYLGVVALIPGLALLIAPLAIVMGILGLVYGSKHPKASAPGHCITAIVLSFLGLIGTVVVLVLIKQGILELPKFLGGTK